MGTTSAYMGQPTLVPKTLARWDWHVVTSIKAG